ncbi:MAG: helix-turn-helix transcriptional regulator [Acidobacteriota bacterium]
MERNNDSRNEAENGYRILFEESPESVLVIDTAGRIARFNEAAHRHLGYSQDEFTRLGIRDIDPFETDEGIGAKVRKVLEEGTAEFDVKQRTKSGDLRDVHVIARVISFGGRNALQSIWRDVTQYNSSLQALRTALQRAQEAKARAETIVESLGEAISIQGPDFRVLYQNRMSRDYVGAHIGEYCYSAYERRGRVCEGCPVAASFTDANPHTMVRSTRTGRGVSFFEITASVLRDSEDRIIAGIEVARDVTARKVAENELCRRIDKLGHAPSELVAAIREVYESGSKLGLPLAKPFAEGEQDKMIPLHEILSARELQVLRMIASGKAGRTIADELSLSVKTVATFRSRILKKMRLANNAQLAQYAIRNGLVD